MLLLDGLISSSRIRVARSLATNNRVKYAFPRYVSSRLFRSWLVRNLNFPLLFRRTLWFFDIFENEANEARLGIARRRTRCHSWFFQFAGKLPRF